MGAGASVEDLSAMDPGAQREHCDKLFDRLDVITDGKLNYLEIKKGFDTLEEEGTFFKISAKKFAHAADKDGDKMIDKDEFFGVMQKVFEKGDIEVGPTPEKTVIVLEEAPPAETAPASGETENTNPAAAAGAPAAEEAPSSEEPTNAAARDSVPTSGLSAEGASVEARVQALFKAIDLNSNGELSLSELEVFLGPEAKEVLTELDPDGSKGGVDSAAWAAFFLGLPPDDASGHLTILEGIVASKNLSDAAPPAATSALGID